MLGRFPQISLAGARKAAARLAGDPGALEARGTLGDLLTAYVTHLEASGKISAKDVKGTFLRAIPEGDALRRRRASQIRPGDITAIIGRRLRDGVTTEANRLRSHLSAAFNHGAKADHDPRRSASSEVRFGLIGNPVTVVARIAEYERTRDRVLAWGELGRYWNALETEPLPIRAALRFALASGGQRLQQVLRLGWADIEQDLVRLIDSKGKGKPRPHVLPLVALAASQIEAVDRKWPRPFPTHQFALSDAITRARKAVGGERFTALDLRRSVETRLADLGVARETLAHLLSHGRSGVQARHYDRAERLDEKRAALEIWERHLSAAIAGRKVKADVVSIKRARRGK